MLKRRCVLKGFTLIELLAVIAVLALLLSVIMPSLVKARELARRTVCLSHLSQLGLICVTYAHENDDWFPDYNVRPGPYGNSNQSSDARELFDGYNGDSRPIWVGYVADYTVEKSTDVFYCPSDRIMTRETRWPVKETENYFFSYAYWGNYWYYQEPSIIASTIPPARKITTIKTSSAIVPLFGDWVLYQAMLVPTPWLVSHTRAGMTRGWGMSEEATGMNSAYADGSARWCNYNSGEISAFVQWPSEGINYRFWGVPRVFLKKGYGFPE